MRESFKHESEMNLKNPSKLSDLSAVIEEGLRICASVPLGISRVAPLGGDIIYGYWLPAGVSIVMRYG